ncbi:MAG: hypothetical protein ABI446_05875 [Gemmatimonadaceae bacterium]
MKKAGVEFGWLHDSIITSIEFRVADNGNRNLEMHMDCPSDCGYEPWEGKKLTVLVSDIALMMHTVFGMQTGKESINFVENGISDITRAKMRAWEHRKFGIDPEAYTIVFHSGSMIEVLCSTIAVLVRA